MHKIKHRLATKHRVAFGYQHLQFMERFYNDKGSASIEWKDDLLQAFNNGKGGRLKANAPAACGSADGARRTAERLSLSHANF
jgi:hypothetical protein